MSTHNPLRDTTLSGNNGKVCSVSAGAYRVWNGTSIVAPAAGAFSDFGTVTFVGGYTVLTERNGRRFQWSGLADPETLPALNFATAEGKDDRIVRGIAINGNLWLFKENSSELWFLTGQANENAFTRGRVIETGLAGVKLVAPMPNGAFMAGSDGRVYIVSGDGLSPISTRAVETALELGEPTGAFYYADEGHGFCVLRFADRPAWVYDVATNLWHERASGVLDGPWNIVDTVFAYGKWRGGQVEGNIGTFARIGSDFGNPLRRVARSRPLYMAGQPFRVFEVEMLARRGEHAGGQAMLRVSKDGGLSWGDEMWRGFGALGNYSTRMTWGPLGLVDRRQIFVAEFAVTDTFDLTVYSSANVRIG